MGNTINNSLRVKIGAALADNSVLYRAENLPLSLSGQVWKGVNTGSFTGIKHPNRLYPTSVLPLDVLATYPERGRFEKLPSRIV